MSSNSKNAGERRNGAAILNEGPQPKQEEQGRAAHEGEQAPPNADDGGRTIAPQMGDPRGEDRKPS